MKKAEKGKRGKRATVLAGMVALLAALLLALNATVWAEEQPVGVPPAEEKQVSQQAAKGLTIDYWELQVGEKAVHYTDDWWNDIHGDINGTRALGYWDAARLYASSVSPINFASSHYYSVKAISHLNPVYFDLKGPWYFNMTTPIEYTEEVVDINQAPEAAEFPEATYAIRYLRVFSGGHRVWGYYYCSNDAAGKAWKTWGYSKEYYNVASEKPEKLVYRYVSPHDHRTPVARTPMSFPISVGSTGSVDAVAVTVKGKYAFTIPGKTWEAVAEGKVVTPAGTHDAVLVRFDASDGAGHHYIDYGWLVQGIGFVAVVDSVVGDTDPVFETAENLVVMKSFTPAGGEKK